MRQIELTLKLGLALIAITAISVVMGVQASYYYIQAADAQQVEQEEVEEEQQPAEETEDTDEVEQQQEEEEQQSAQEEQDIEDGATITSGDNNNNAERTVPSQQQQIGGGGAAVTGPRLPNDSVRSENIVDGQVQTQDLADNAVTSPKIADGTITLNVHEVRGEVLTLDPGETGTAIAFCPDGEILTGGGFETDYAVHVATSAQRGNGDNAWVVEGANDVASIPLHMEAAAYCLDPTIP